MKNALLMLAVLWLTGCSSLSYQEPTQGPRARVRFVATSTDVTVLRAYDNANCSEKESEWMRLRTGVLINSSPRSLGLPLWQYHPNAAKEVFVRANKPTTAMFIGGETKAFEVLSCGTPFTYSFVEGADYEVRFEWNPDRCNVTISQFVRDGGAWSLAELARFDNKVNESNRGCLAQFNKMRLY